MKRGERIILILISMFILISTAHLASASDVLVWQGQYYTGTTFNTGTYEFNFSVYDALTGGNLCYSNATDLTTGNFGEWTTEQFGVSSACNNASKEYFLNINIGGTDQLPRRRLMIWNFLRKDVDETTAGKLQIDNQVIAPIVQANAQIIAPIINSSYILASEVNVSNNANIVGILRANSPLKIKQNMQYVNPDEEVIYSSFVQGQNAFISDIPEIFNNSLVYLKIKSLLNNYGYRVVYFDNITKQSLFTLSRNVNGRASTIFNLMIVPENRTTDSSFNLCQGNYIDCASNEPDLLVYDDIESLGSVFSNENMTAQYFIGDGSKLTGISSARNFFNQDLNITSNVSFNHLNVTNISFGTPDRYLSSNGPGNLDLAMTTPASTLNIKSGNGADGSEVRIDSNSIYLTGSWIGLYGGSELWGSSIIFSTSENAFVISDDIPNDQTLRADTINQTVFVKSLIAERNITSSGTGFFSSLGSLTNRINSTFVKNIYFNGIVNGTGNITTTGRIQGNYYSSDGSQGLTDTTHYWACIGKECTETCGLQIINGLITGCKT